MMKEFNILESLGHDHIIRLYKVLPNGVGVCAIMQYISEDILKYIKRNRGIKENEAESFFSR